MRVAGAPGHALDRSLGQPEVEDGVEHAGHRHRRSGANREQQRVIGIAELLSAGVLQLAHGAGDLVIETSRQLTAVAHVLDACGRGDGEAAGHVLGTQYPGDLGKICALVAEQLAHLGGAVLEWVDPSSGFGGAAQGFSGRISITATGYLLGSPAVPASIVVQHGSARSVQWCAITRCASSTRRVE